MSVKRMSNADYLRALRQRAAAEGKCYQCRHRPARIGARYCDECIQRSAAVTKSCVQRRLCICCFCNLPRGQRQQLCPSCRAEEQERDAKRRADRIAAGLCTACGKRDHAPGLRRCLACSEDGRLRQLAWNREQGMQPAPRCSICIRLGLPGTNHIAKTHARHMALEAQWRSA